MKKFMLHSAVTIIGDKGPPIMITPEGKPIHLYPDAKDEEVCQFGAECMKGMPESYFRKAFREMEEACLKAAITAGLVTIR